MSDGRFFVDVPENVVSSADVPFVVVCGWFGAKDSNVRKYTDELVKMGCATLRTTLPGALVFSPYSGGREKYAFALLTAVRAARQERGLMGPLYLMFMSNGGCWLHATLSGTGMLSREFADLDLAVSRGGGLIFDSSPAFMTVTSGAKVVTLGMSPVTRAVVTGGYYLAAACMVLGTIVTTGGLDALPVRKFWKDVREAPGRREMYLYSDSDPLTDSDKVAVGLDAGAFLLTPS
jgi:hypothetical protein